MDSDNFFSGNCELGAYRAYDRFEKVAAVLGAGTRQEIIDTLDQHRARGEGDQWQFYKYACRDGCWSTAADFEAVLRVAITIPDEISDEEAGQYGPEFLVTARAAKREIGVMSPTLVGARKASDSEAFDH